MLLVDCEFFSCHIHVPLLRAAGMSAVIKQREMSDQLLSSHVAKWVVSHGRKVVHFNCLALVAPNSGPFWNKKQYYAVYNYRPVMKRENCLPASEMSCVPSLHQRDIRGPAGCKKNKEVITPLCYLHTFFKAISH